MTGVFFLRFFRVILCVSQADVFQIVISISIFNALIGLAHKWKRTLQSEQSRRLILLNLVMVRQACLEPRRRAHHDVCE